MGHRGEAGYAGDAKRRAGERDPAETSGGALRAEVSRGEAEHGGPRPDRGQEWGEADEDCRRVGNGELYRPSGYGGRAKRHDEGVRPFAAKRYPRSAG